MQAASLLDYFNCFRAKANVNTTSVVRFLQMKTGSVLD